MLSKHGTLHNELSVYNFLDNQLERCKDQLAPELFDGLLLLLWQGVMKMLRKTCQRSSSLSVRKKDKVKQLLQELQHLFHADGKGLPSKHMVNSDMQTIEFFILS